jgi:hypothetical protein
VTDAVDTSTGGFALLPDNQAPKDVGTWISFPGADRTIRVPARTPATATSPGKIGELDVPLSITVPAAASPGDHVGGITVSLTSDAVSPTGQKYKLVQRVGARVFVRVIGKLRPQLSIENLTVAFHHSRNPLGSGTATLTYTVHNTGNVALGGEQAVSVRGLFGATARAQHVPTIPLLLPGFSVQERVVVHGVVPEFRETGQVTLIPLKIAGAVLPPAGPWTASTTIWAIPLWVVLLVALLGLLAAVELWLRRRRLRPRLPGSGGGPGGPDGPVESPPPAPGDQTLSPEKSPESNPESNPAKSPAKVMS